MSNLSHLDALEAEAIYIMREVAAECEKPVMLYSIGKDSSVMLHPTEKPVALMEWLINTYTNKGETILDNCMGVGGSGIAAKNLERNYIGIELDQKYFKIAKERIEAA